MIVVILFLHVLLYRTIILFMVYLMYNLIYLFILIKKLTLLSYIYDFLILIKMAPDMRSNFSLLIILIPKMECIKTCTMLQMLCLRLE